MVERLSEDAALPTDEKWALHNPKGHHMRISRTLQAGTRVHEKWQGWNRKLPVTCQIAVMMVTGQSIQWLTSIDVQMMAACSDLGMCCARLAYRSLVHSPSKAVCLDEATHDSTPELIVTIQGRCSIRKGFLGFHVPNKTRLRGEWDLRCSAIIDVQCFMVRAPGVSC